MTGFSGRFTRVGEEVDDLLDEVDGEEAGADQDLGQREPGPQRLLTGVEEVIPALEMEKKENVKSRTISARFALAVSTIFSAPFSISNTTSGTMCIMAVARRTPPPRHRRTEEAARCLELRRPPSPQPRWRLEKVRFKPGLKSTMEKVRPMDSFHCEPWSEGDRKLTQVPHIRVLNRLKKKYR